MPHSIHAPSEIITTYDEMFEARPKEKDTIFSIRVAKVHGDDCKVRVSIQHLFQGFISQTSHYFCLKQHSTFNYPEDGTSVVMAATMLTGVIEEENIPAKSCIWFKFCWSEFEFSQDCMK